MKEHVYQLAIRRADDKRKQFVIESDLVYSEQKLTKEYVQEIAEKQKCDVRVTYLGVLTKAKNEEILDGVYHTKEMIQDTIFNWKEKEREAFTNDGLENTSI